MHSKDHQIMMYGRFAVMMVQSFFVMFAFMYAMVDRIANVYRKDLLQPEGVQGRHWAIAQPLQCHQAALIPGILATRTTGI